MRLNEIRKDYSLTLILCHPLPIFSKNFAHYIVCHYQNADRSTIPYCHNNIFRSFKEFSCDKVELIVRSEFKHAFLKEGSAGRDPELENIELLTTYRSSTYVEYHHDLAVMPLTANEWQP